MFKLIVALALASLASRGYAQNKISARLESWGGNAYVVTFRPDADMAVERERMREQGFDLIEHPDLRPHDLLVAGTRVGALALASWDEVVYVLPASPDLVALEPVVACAGPVVEGQEGPIADEYVVNGRGWAKDSAGIATLKFAFLSVTQKVEEGAARAEIERALREWEKVANLTFTRTDEAGGSRTVAIRFAEGAHGDSYPFDGPGRSLAHTFYPAPPNPEPVAGDMHFDLAENWRIGASLDLYSVALHEAGHALGLGHSDQPGTVMYPYYHQAYGLTSDDIAGIQSLYGARASSGTPVTPPPTTPTPPPTSPPPSAPSTDRTPPSLQIKSPGKTNVATTAASLAISGTSADDSGVMFVKWSTSTGDAGVATGTANWNLTAPLYVGTTTVTVRAYDAAGNSSWRSVTVTRR